MQHQAFQIGLEFECGGRRWRCTDVGTRTVIAIALESPEDPSWYNGPPYAVAEAVFDEYDIEACKPVEDNPEIHRSLKAVENAVAQQRLEELAVPPDVVADMERAARGEIGIEEGIQNTREKFTHGKSEAFAAIHETMDALHQIQAIDERTMRDFDAVCLGNLSEMEPEEICALRQREGKMR